MINEFFKYLHVSPSMLSLRATQTLYMVFVSLFIGSFFALILSFLLVLTREGGIKENKVVFFVLNSVINVVRSVPFIILLVFILPVTKAIVGTRIGTTAALV
ncbi:MAG: ABC transporter permease, partial [Succinivibrio sp.]|nr:ABC transporter permease [Succinivibrio sp.]